MAYLHQYKNTKTITASVFQEPAGLDGVWRLHKCHIWYSGLYFLNIGNWGCPSKVNNAMLGYSIAKKVKMIFPTL